MNLLETLKKPAHNSVEYHLNKLSELDQKIILEKLENQKALNNAIISSLKNR